MLFNKQNRKEESQENPSANDTYGSILAKLAQSNEPIFNDSDDSLANR
jgi:hypothetical protein